MSTSSTGSETSSAVDWVRRALDARADPAQPVRLWWRDDDAATVAPRHDAAMGAFARAGIAPLVAAIPAALDDALAHRAAKWPAGTAVAVHGYAHVNHAPEADKKAEFGAARSADAVAGDLAAGWARIEAAFGQRALPVFVPPWNRIAPQHVARLALAGFAALSTYGDQHVDAAEAHGIAVANTHIDLVDWKGGRVPKPLAALAAEFEGAIAERSTVGIVSHMLGVDAINTREALAAIASWVAADSRLTWVTPRAVFPDASQPTAP